MSMDHSGGTGGTAAGAGTSNINEQEGLMFGATPVWERGKKRRGMGRGGAAASAGAAATPAAEPRSFETRDSVSPPSPHNPEGAHETDTAALGRPNNAFGGTAAGMGAGTAAAAAMSRDHDAAVRHEPLTQPATTVGNDVPMAAPIGRTAGTRTTTTASARRKSGAAAPAIALGVAAVAALGAAGWYATRGDDGVAELTPGAPAMSQGVSIAQNDAGAAGSQALAPPATVEPGDPSTPAATAAATPRATATRTTTVRTASATRTRPAAAASVSETSIDASGTASLPAGPQPYSALGSSAGGGTTAASESSGVTPAPQVAPTPMPSTPPITSGPAPTTPAPSTSPSTAAPPETPVAPQP